MTRGIETLDNLSSSAFDRNLEFKRTHKNQIEELKGLYSELNNEHKLGILPETGKIIAAFMSLGAALFNVKSDESRKLLAASGILSAGSDAVKAYNQKNVQKLNGELDKLRQLMTDVDKNRDEAIDCIRKIDRIMHEILSQELKIKESLLH